MCHWCFHPTRFQKCVVPSFIVRGACCLLACETALQEIPWRTCQVKWCRRRCLMKRRRRMHSPASFFPASPGLIARLTRPHHPPHPVSSPASTGLIARLTRPHRPPHPATSPASPGLITRLTRVRHPLCPPDLSFFFFSYFFSFSFCFFVYFFSFPFFTFAPLADRCFRHSTKSFAYLFSFLDPYLTFCISNNIEEKYEMVVQWFEVITRPN